MLLVYSSGTIFLLWSMNKWKYRKTVLFRQVTVNIEQNKMCVFRWSTMQYMLHASNNIYVSFFI